MQSTGTRYNLIQDPTQRVVVIKQNSQCQSITKDRHEVNEGSVKCLFYLLV